MIYAIYNLLALLAAIALAPALLFYRFSRGAAAASVRERAGFYGKSTPCDVLLHCSSVGEVAAAAPLIEKLGREAGLAVVLSVMTETGRTQARQRFPALRVIAPPFDFAPVTNRCFGVFRPRALVIFETELWLNLVHSARRAGAAALLVNGRIGERSFARTKRLRFFYRSFLPLIGRFLMRTETDAARIVEMGAPPERTLVRGNIKFDAVADAPRTAAEELFAGARVVVAGSTHPGENEAVARVFARLRRTRADALLLLAPRHLEKLPEAAAALEAAGLRFSRRRDLKGPPQAAQLEAVLLDTHGELASLYRTGAVCFVGGSLAPIGGHNILEAMAAGRPVIFGPHMRNFEVETRLALGEGAGIVVADEEGLYEAASRLLDDPALADEMGAKGLRALAGKRGALDAYYREIAAAVAEGRR